MALALRFFGLTRQSECCVLVLKKQNSSVPEVDSQHLVVVFFLITASEASMFLDLC